MSQTPAKQEETAPPFQSFYFDCDSTLSSIEGVDELTRDLSPELRTEILQLTHKAMEGSMPLAQVYEERLQVLAPDRDKLQQVGSFYIENVVTDAADTIAALQFLDKTVGIVSGGLRQPVAILAKHLGIADKYVHAVEVLFHDDGSYRDFDHQSPLWRNMGKIEVLQALPAEQRPVLFLGDGITDLETKDCVDLFVGFGGIVHRPAVAQAAPAFLKGPGLAGILQLGLSDEEQQRLRQQARFQHLLA